MSTISREDNETEKKDQLENKEAEETTDMTPWQIANQAYLQQRALEEKKLKAEEAKLAAENNEESASPEEETEAAETKTSDEEVPESEKEEPTEESEPAKEEKPLEKPKPKSGPVNGSFLERLPNLRHIRHTRLFRRVMILISVLGIPALILLYYVSPLSKLAGISVEGNQHITSSQVKKDLNFSVGTNLWSQYFNQDTYVTRLKKAEIRVEDATISFNGVNHFVVTVKEYKEVAYLEKNNRYFPILSNGKITTTSNKQAEKDLPILKKFKNPKRILSLLQQYNKLSNEVQSGISQINYAPTKTNKDLLKIYMNDGNQVLVNISQLKSKMKYYPQVAADMKEQDLTGIVDMEAGIYAYSSTAESSTTESSATTTSTTDSSASNESVPE